MRYFAFPAFVLLVTNLVLRFIHGPDPVPQLPRLMLWAWESPQDLRFVPPGKAGIAFLAQTIWLNGERVRSRPRLQPLRFNPGTDLVAVVRFESEGKGLPPQAEVIREIAPVLKIAGIRALQIDFDAMYTGLLLIGLSLGVALANWLIAAIFTLVRTFNDRYET